MGEELKDKIRITVAEHSQVDVDGDIYIVSPKAFAYELFNVMVECDCDFMNELVRRGKKGK